MLTIADILNTGDGVTVLARLEMPPAGTVAFEACRLVTPAAGYLASAPDLTGAGEPRSVPLSPTGPPLVYTLTLAPDGTSPGARAAWFVRAVDDDGPTPWAPVWLGTANTDALNETAAALQDILVAHEGHLNLAMAPYAPFGAPVTVQQILTGMQQEGERYPIIDIAVTGWADEMDEVSPPTTLFRVQGSLYCYAFHENPTSWRALMTGLAMGVRDVLMQNHLLDLSLPSGLSLTHCTVGNVEVSEVDDGTQFWTQAVLQWSAMGGMGLP